MFLKEKYITKHKSNMFTVFPENNKQYKQSLVDYVG